MSRRPLRSSPGHGQKRTGLNVIAIVMIVAGIPLIVSGCSEWTGVIGGSDVTAAESAPFWERGSTFGEEKARMHNDFRKSSEKGFSGFIQLALGGILVVGGFGLLKFANMGVVARYAAGEIVPVANDVAHDAAPAVASVAGALAGGLRSAGVAAPGEAGRIAHGCGTLNDSDDRFCKGCGETLVAPQCGSCGGENDLDARFCDSCGAALPA